MIETALFGTFFIVISVVATVGNLLVMIAIYSNNSLRTTSNYLLANLALTDFLQGLISVPLRVAETVIISEDIRTLCQVAIPVSILFGSTSNLNILFISIDRFVAIFVPYFYLRKVTPQVICLIIISVWVFMLMFSLAPLTGLGGQTPEGPVTICRFHFFLSQTYITVLYVIVHAIPIITVILIYGFILRASLRHARQIHIQESAGIQSNAAGDEPTTVSMASQNPTTSARKNIAKQMKAARIVSYVLGFFIVLVAPIVVVDVVEMLGGPQAPKQFVKLAVCMIYTNHCVNVFVYAGCNQEFRKAFLKILSQFRNFICCNKP